VTERRESNNERESQTKSSKKTERKELWGVKKLQENNTVFLCIEGMHKAQPLSLARPFFPLLLLTFLSVHQLITEQRAVVLHSFPLLQERVQERQRLAVEKESETCCEIHSSNENHLGSENGSQSESQSESENQSENENHSSS